jgi:hypothetical protein
LATPHSTSHRSRDENRSTLQRTGQIRQSEIGGEFAAHGRNIRRRRRVVDFLDLLELLLNPEMRSIDCPDSSLVGGRAPRMT